MTLILAGCATTDSTRHSAAPTRLALDFNTANPWPNVTTSASAATIAASVSWQPVGTIDVAKTADASGALLLTVDSSKSTDAWEAALVSGPIPVALGEKNSDKITLGFMLSASAPRPVRVRVESLDANERRTGGLEGFVYPAAADFYQRYSLDLSTLKPFGKGRFKPTSPLVRFSFGIARAADGHGWPAAANHKLRVDNVAYAGPTFYVSPKGSDTADGRTEKTAFATPQAALDVAQPGDIILVQEGTYRTGPAKNPTVSNAGLAPVADFVRAGTPAAWITLKNYPGQRPAFTGNAWSLVRLKLGSKPSEEGIETVRTLAYLEVRGLHLRGEADVVKTKYADLIGKAAPQTNTTGVDIDSRYTTHPTHHIRVADCVAEYCPGMGFTANEADWVVFENNISRCNSWFTIYGTSGFSLMGTGNFDTTDNVYKQLIRNNVSHRNETYVVCVIDKRLTDGNGIILDYNQHTPYFPKGVYIGRTLVTGNLCYDNGGSGIHSVHADRIDIFNNTCYLNSASTALQYSQIFTYASKDVRIFNNILVAPVANVAAGEKPEPVNTILGESKDVVFSHNLYFGGNIPAFLGEGDRVADPLFVNPSRDPAVADFQLRPGSPAIETGTSTVTLPPIDLAGRIRVAPPTLGALEPR